MAHYKSQHDHFLEWCNICIDLVSFISEIFKGTAFLSLDGIIVSASCKLRKVFTMKLQPQDTADEYEQISNHGTASARSIRNQDACHIAFGSRVLGPPPATGRKISTSGTKEDDFRSRFIGQIPSPHTNPGTSVYTHSPGISKTTIQMRSCSSESRSSGESLKSIPSDIKVSDGGFPALKKADGEKVRTSVLPTPSLSPTGNRLGLLIDTLDSTNRLRSGQDNHLRASFNRKSLKEIPRDGTRLSMENSDYDWRNYQPTRMSASELRMLASLQRQQNEELEDDGNSPGLSASQIDNCNVSISTSSDDTTTWNSCQPPPVNQGHHYQKEMNPPAHSNPRWREEVAVVEAGEERKGGVWPPHLGGEWLVGVLLPERREM
ncbi:UNVERIFIED_CONTAM: hypothetical protein FKN15_009235 [Acipenser sinensis]